MAENPPTYEEATSRDPWKIIVAHLSPSELKVMCSVNRSTAEHATGLLWAKPPDHFGVDDEDVYRSFCQFINSLQVARLSTRRKTHTLDLTRIKPSLIGSSVLPLDWLRTLFQRLPNLQSFLVDALLDFDTASLRVLGGCDHPDGCDPNQHQMYGIRLLTAYAVPNAIPSSFECSLQCFPYLIYLDLSFTRAANNIFFLKQIGSNIMFPALEVLKLRNIGLGDAGLIALAAGVGTRIWSVDVRQNLLTDAGVLALLRFCVLKPDFVSSTNSHKDRMDYMNGLGPEDNESSVVHWLAGSPNSRPYRQHWTGLTHLYISDNPQISMRSMYYLITAWRLIVLDWGRLQYLPTGLPLSQAYPAAQLLLITLEAEMQAGARLHYLRVDHLLVTREYAAVDAGWEPHRVMTNFPDGSEDLIHGPLFCANKLPGLGLHTLVLTGLPSRSATGWLTKGLLAFLYRCASEESAVRDDPQVASVDGYPTINLRELRLELQDGLLTDQLDADFARQTFHCVVDTDFSFFRDFPSHSTSSVTQHKVNPYEGDIIRVLKKFRKHAPWKWSGKLVVVLPPDNQRHDMVNNLERSFII
ncbi:MAG: hypothetical protein M1830_000376 [Pleopsidium flavum]|nr:MAG: hypothetical protein M1830_000376 [Pleopsidium flavum]